METRSAARPGETREGGIVVRTPAVWDCPAGNTVPLCWFPSWCRDQVWLSECFIAAFFYSQALLALLLPSGKGRHIKHLCFKGYVVALIPYGSGFWWLCTKWWSAALYFAFCDRKGAKQVLIIKRQNWHLLCKAGGTCPTSAMLPEELSPPALLSCWDVAY